MRATSISRAIGRGGPLKIDTLRVLKWPGANQGPFQGPQKSQFSGPTPSNVKRNGFAHIKGTVA